MTMQSIGQFLKRPPWRTVVPLLTFLTLAYGFWSPGKRVRDGRHDLGRNGIWLQHGCLATMARSLS